MFAKDIKAEVRKQLKKHYPNWNRLNRKKKKKISKAVLEEVVNSYDLEKPIDTPLCELLGIEDQVPSSEVMSLEEMAGFIEAHHNSLLFPLKQDKRHASYIQDEELRIIDELLDDQIINKLLFYEGYTPAMRDFSPSMFLRAEILKAIKYAEISYRKFCGDDKAYKNHKATSPYIGMKQKENRCFIGLPLVRQQMISHVQLSQFRKSLSFSQNVNLLVYILYQFKQHGYLSSEDLYFVDSTELATDNHQLLATVEIKGQKIRIYSDIDCDCGKRRKKRDKSEYVIGYRLHTLTAINPQTGHSYPLLSVLAAANHHDSNFLLPLINLAQAIGLDVKLITADEAYNDSKGELFEETGVHLIKPPSTRVLLPENVDAETMQVTLDDHCQIAMDYVGVENGYHEFKCGAASGECFRAVNCAQFRQIPIDNGYFQRILYDSESVAKAIEIRKNGERPFNLLKHREGLEPIRVRSQHALFVRSTIATMATLLLEIAGTRKKKDKKKTKAEQLPIAAGF